MKMEVFKVRKTRETGVPSMGTLDSVHQDVVRGLIESNSQREELTAELTRLRAQVESVHVSNVLGDIITCSALERRIHEISEDLSHVNPLTEYYIKNMDILTEYYQKGGDTMVATVNPKETNTLMKFFAGASTDGGVS
jgi:hypothetical protein